MFKCIKGKCYRLKYTIIELMWMFLYVSLIDSIKVFFIKREDCRVNGYSNKINKLPWKISSDKKIVVVIDDSIPRYDFTAGGKTLKNYIDVYKKMGYVVKFLPDNFLKKEPYTTDLENEGVEVMYGKWWRKNYCKWFIENSARIEFVMLNAPRSIKYIEFLKYCAKVKTFYYDMDIYFVREELRFDVTKDKKYLRMSKFHKFIEKKIFSLADINLTISDKENEFIKKLINKDNVVTIPCYIYNDSINLDYITSERNNLLFVGGHWETANFDGIKWFIEKIFPKVCEKNPNIKLIIVGFYEKKIIDRYRNDNIIFTGFISDEQLKQLHLISKIFIAPLRFGAGVKGKVVDAIHYGLPIVSTDFGIEGLKGNVEEFVTIANTENDFANSILKLYDNGNILEKYSKISKLYSNEYFSSNAAIKVLNSILGK